MANSIIQSIKTIAKSLVDNAGYDKTRGGMIVGVNDVTNTYSVKIDGITYNNVKTVDDATYNLGDMVKVIIPCNQATQMYISASIFSDSSLGNRVTNALTLAGEAEQLGLDNVIEIGRVEEIAESKNKTFRQPSEPTSGMDKGDIWIDTDDGNKMYIWDGTQWAFSGGGDGQDGLNNATILLYQRGATAPSKPTADLTYTFATASLSPTSALNGWTQTIPVIDGNPCWVIAATATATTSTDVIAMDEWTSQIKFVEDGRTGATGATGADGATGATGATGSTGRTGATGATGADGATGATGATGSTGRTGATGATGADGADGLNQATIFLYSRTTSTKPSSSVTYTFSTGALSSIPTGWSRIVPATDGNPCYVTTAVAIGYGATATISSNAWSTPTKLVEDGATGATGADGATGATGATGAIGATGATGSTGATGATGADGQNGKMLYGTCSTAADTTAKVVVCSEATSLYAGLTITVKFSTANTVLAPTLNVNSLGAKAIWVDNLVTSTSNCLFWNTNALITFTYDGTQWVVVDQPTSYYVACSTAATTATKVATVANSVVRKGTRVTITFTYAHNSASNASLYITGTSTNANRAIYINNTFVNNTNGNSWSAGESVTFIFNGQYWYAAIEPKGDVEISIETISYPNQTATLKAILFVNGKVVTPTSYQWSYGDTPTTISGATSQTLSITSTSAGGLGLNAKYNCAVTW